MSSQSVTVNVPNVTLILDQLLVAVRQLDKTARVQVARADRDGDRVGCAA